MNAMGRVDPLAALSNVEIPFHTVRSRQEMHPALVITG
jgi:hypothetical protein